MAYIAPNTDIQFFPDVGLSPRQENTFYFASTAAKDSYFDALPKLGAVQSCSYTRGTKGAVKVQLPISQIYNAGYMRYRNASFENKWFYAFVTDVEYINNVTTEVFFTPDVIMTWAGSYTLGQCLVEREHTLSDNIGEHLIDEGIGCGDYVINRVDTITPYSPRLVISSTIDSISESGGIVTTSESYGIRYHGFMLSGLCYHSFDISTASGVSDALSFIELLIKNNLKDSIVALRIVPAYCVPERIADGAVTGLTVNAGGTFGASAISQLDGYTPVNKKMLSFPYITYEVINGEGGAVEYRPELFANALQPSFIYRGVCFDNCEAVLVPTGYRKSGLAQVYDECIYMRSFPQASYQVEQYEAYLAQLTSGGGWLNVAKGLFSDLTQAAKGDYAGAGIGLVNQGLDLLHDIVHYDSLPPAVQGSSNANMMSALGNKSFLGYYKTIMSERARSIDRFFTMYGYRVNLVKTPSCNNRPHWTYVKTRGCIVHGSLPASDAAEIEAAFDRGIRFWINPSEIGNFSLNNAPGV